MKWTSSAPFHGIQHNTALKWIYKESHRLERVRVSDSFTVSGSRPQFHWHCSVRCGSSRRVKPSISKALRTCHFTCRCALQTKAWHSHWVSSYWYVCSGSCFISWFNSLAPGGVGYRLKLVNFKHISAINIWSIFCEIIIRWMTQYLTDH